MLVGKVFIDASFLQRGNDTGLGGGADNGHRIALLLEGLELLRRTGARSAFLAQLGGDGTKLTVNVGISLIGRHGKAMLLLEANEHTTEVLANEVLKQLLNGVPLRLAPFLEDLISQVGASLKSQTLRQAEGIVAVEQDVFDLKTADCKYLGITWHIIHLEWTWTRVRTPSNLHEAWWRVRIPRAVINQLVELIGGFLSRDDNESVKAIV